MFGSNNFFFFWGGGGNFSKIKIIKLYYKKNEENHKMVTRRRSSLSSHQKRPGPTRTKKINQKKIMKWLINSSTTSLSPACLPTRVYWPFNTRGGRFMFICFTYPLGSTPACSRAVFLFSVAASQYYDFIYTLK